MTEQTRIINIEGMTCENCVKSVHNVVSKLAGIQTVSVSLEFNQATVTFDENQVSADQIASAINDAGFSASVANT